MPLWICIFRQQQARECQLLVYLHIFCVRLLRLLVLRRWAIPEPRSENEQQVRLSRFFFINQSPTRWAQRHLFFYEKKDKTLLGCKYSKPRRNGVQTSMLVIVRLGKKRIFGQWQNRFWRRRRERNRKNLQRHLWHRINIPVRRFGGQSPPSET